MRSGKERVRPKEPMRSDMAKLRSRDFEELLEVNVVDEYLLTGALELAVALFAFGLDGPAMIGVLPPIATTAGALPPPGFNPEFADHLSDSSAPPNVLISDMVKSVPVDWNGVKPVEAADPFRCTGGWATLWARLTNMSAV